MNLHFREFPLYFTVVFLIARTLASFNIFLDDASFVWVLCMIGLWAIFWFALRLSGYKSND